jgi:cation diffusion facilitator family transporter
MATGRRVAAAGMAVSAVLAAIKLAAGLRGHSTAVVGDGLESAADVLSSGVVFLGLTLAARPPDENHPYGHGRIETLTGLLIGLALSAGGALICYGSLVRIGLSHTPPAAYVIWPLVISLAAKAALAAYKFREGKKLGSESIRADAWNDLVDTVSALVALGAVGLAIMDPARFVDADEIGGFLVGLIVITVGAMVAYRTAMQLIDTMPPDDLMNQIRVTAEAAPEVRGVEKCFARKTGMRYHVDLHLEVDPQMTVRRSHEVAHDVRQHILQTLDWVADVLVHVEPAPDGSGLRYDGRRAR